MKEKRIFTIKHTVSYGNAVAAPIWAEDERTALGTCHASPAT